MLIGIRQEGKSLFLACQGATILSLLYYVCDMNVYLKSRYVCTSITSVHQMDNGFNMWSFSGKLIYRLPRDRFFQVKFLYAHGTENISLILAKVI